MRRALLAFIVAALAITAARAWGADRSADVGGLLERLRAVGPEGVGNEAAAAAWRELAARPADEIPLLLGGIDGANPLAANWICTAVDSVAGRALEQGQPLPAPRLEAFLHETQHVPRARRLAYEWLVRADASAEKRLVPTMLDDPSLELRREAVARAIDEAAALEQAGQPDAARRSYQRAWEAARDIDQIRQLAARLRKLGAPPDVARHLGFLLEWHLIGPFDNTGRTGFARVDPPERGVDLAAEYAGKHGLVRWTPWTSQDEFGVIDANKALVEEKQVAAYATTVFVSPRPQEVQFRLTSINALKVWLNGRLVAQHEVYHGGSQLDQYIAPATLQAGRNVLLVKVCQNEQTQDWAKFWGFQFRVCDKIGTAILSQDRGGAGNSAAKTEGPR